MKPLYDKSKRTHDALLAKITTAYLLISIKNVIIFTIMGNVNIFLQRVHISQ